MCDEDLDRNKKIFAAGVIALLSTLVIINSCKDGQEIRRKKEIEKRIKDTPVLKVNNRAKGYRVLLNS